MAGKDKGAVCWSLACGFLALASVQGSRAAERAESRTTPAQFLQPGSGSYEPRKKDREAMVVMRVRVEPDGTASKAEIIDGFYSAAYAAGALRYARDMRYVPARRDGMPIASDYVFVVDYRINQTPGLRRSLAPEFVEAAGEASRLVEANDIAGARAQIEHMVSDLVVSVFEFRVMQAVLAQSYDRTGQSLEVAAYCDTATSMPARQRPKYQPGGRPPRLKRTDYALPEPLLSETLRRCFRVQAELGHTYRALGTYNELLALSLLDARDPAHELARVQQQRLAAVQPLLAHSAIRWDGTWSHDPYRRVVALRDVRGGNLRSLQVTCGKERRMLEAAEGRAWRLPPSWKDCRLMFEGGPGTRFDIVESDEDIGATILLD